MKACADPKLIGHLFFAVLALTMSACTLPETTQPPNHSSQGQIPHSGCPAYAKVSYFSSGLYTRIYHGSTSWVGGCDETDPKRQKEMIGLMGLWAEKLVANYKPANSLPMLERIQGKTLPNGQPLPDTFIGTAFGQPAIIDFPCEPETKEIIGSETYNTRACSYREQNRNGTTLTTFDARWAQDPYDHEAWVIVDCGPSARFSANPQITQIQWSAVDIDFELNPQAASR